METKATPRPWKNDGGWNNSVLIYATNPIVKNIAHVIINKEGRAEALANAELILKAVNGFDELEAENAKLKELLLQSEAVEYKTAGILKTQTIGLLKAENKRFRDAMEKLNDLIFYTDDDGHRVCFPMDMDFGTIRDTVESALKKQ